MARMPKASRTEAALSPKGRGADSGGESEAAKGGCEETNPLTETMQECMQKIFYFFGLRLKYAPKIVVKGWNS
jgi:hypothetical protein